MRRGAVAVIVEEDRFLIIRRSKSVVAPGAYCFPGGAIEAGESEQEALVRELREELAAQVRPIRRVWQSVTPWHVELAWWLAELPPGQVPVPQPSEVESVHWVTRDQLFGLSGLLESNRHFLAACQRGEIVLQ